jgi:hypothetical protein
MSGNGRKSGKNEFSKWKTILLNRKLWTLFLGFRFVWKIWDFTECMFNALLTHCKKIRLFYFSARQKNSSWDGMTHSFFRRQRSSYLFQYWCSQKNTWVPYLPFPWTIGPMVDLVDGHFFVNLPSHQSLYHIYYIVKRQTKKKR